jgi:hypothetical protein
MSRVVTTADAWGRGGGGGSGDSKRQSGDLARASSCWHAPGRHMQLEARATAHATAAKQEQALPGVLVPASLRERRWSMDDGWHLRCIDV